MDSTQEDKSFVAEQIFKQLGGNRFKVMTGSHSFAASKRTLVMKLRRNKSKANYLKIKLNGMDVYDMYFYKIGASAEMKLMAEKNGVYDDMLEGLFTEVTGLYTRL